ncbi:putative transposon TX1 [Thelohanellus kitauei]|uniref:Putative transposon TX1 n=1 Tax=Thelohanellus kitauei TaxID=669202 RepID=A0A0C2IHL6_THEKT|nr:putative transposon TX1 [Thelohanellus kitauei]
MGRKRTIATCRVKDTDGNTLCSPEEVDAVWVNHFRNLHSVEERTLPTCHTNHDSTLDLTKEEITEAKRGMKWGKAAGSDGVPHEVFKLATLSSSPDNKLLEFVNKLISSVWESEKIPTCWAKATIVPISKMGDLSCIDNYRGISLIPIATKIIANIILDRIKPLLEETL